MSPSATPAATNDSRRPRVAFLGPLGTYSHQATTDFFGTDCELAPQSRIADVFTALSPASTSRCEFGLVPIENSSFGPVEETMERLRSTDLSVRGMTSLRVGHALLASKEAPWEKSRMKRVYSHEQGIGQCKRYLANSYPFIEIIQVASTALAAQHAASDPEALAICSHKCAEVYDLDVVDTDIQDAGAANTTRFIALSPSHVPLPPCYPVNRKKILDFQKEESEQ
ncbi:hypothetical protein JCM11641_007410 [Rhodosporidiobolus odoratus]